MKNWMKTVTFYILLNCIGAAILAFTLAVVFHFDIVQSLIVGVACALVPNVARVIYLFWRTW